MAGEGRGHVEPGRAGAFAVFASPRIDHDWHDTTRQKQIVAEALTGMGWHVPRMLDGLPAATDLYFDSISRVTVGHWSRGRIALLGDAGYGVTLGGMGVGTGVVGAYVLAGELAAADGDHRVALPAYERRLRPYAARWQKGANPGRFLAPATATGLRLRNALFGSRVVQRMLVGATASVATRMDLPDYPAGQPA